MSVDVLIMMMVARLLFMGMCPTPAPDLVFELLACYTVSCRTVRTWQIDHIYIYIYIYIYNGVFQNNVTFHNNHP